MGLIKADIEADRVNINKSIRRPKEGFKPLKNAQSKCSILLDDIAYNSIKPLLKTEGQYLFGGLEPLCPTSITRNFDSAIKKAELPHYRIHDLRHPYISNAILNGIDIVTVSKYVGHSNVEMIFSSFKRFRKKNDR